jgi:hypothetical protein
MRFTGLLLAILGVVVLAYCGVSALVWDSNAQDSGTLQVEKGVARGTERPGPNSLLYPLVVSLGLLGVGGAMYAYGGKGYIVSNNLAVRN